MSRRTDELTEKHSHRFTALSDDLFEVELGYETVRLNKVYGPLIFQDIQIRPDPSTCEWVIERTDWIEVHRIAGQMPEDGFAQHQLR